MPRALTPRKLRGLLDQQTSEVFLVVLEIEHESLAEPLRFVRNSVAIVHDGITYNPAPFDAPMVAEVPGELPEVTILVDAVDRLVLDAALSFTTPARITYGLIMVGEPGWTHGPYRFTWRDTRYDARTLEIVLGGADLLNAPDAEHEFTPGNYPGMFR